MFKRVMFRSAMIWLALVAVGDCRLNAGDPSPWPQFRGPDGAGLAGEQHPPVEFGPKQNVLWQVPAPGGLSSMIAVGDLLALTAYENGKLWTVAYHRHDGSEAWRAEAPFEHLEPYHPQEGSPAASTPATDGELIVSYFGSCGLFCYDTAGREVWQHSMPTAATLADFGTGVSPIIADGLVILLRNDKTAPQILALDVKTGAVKWQKTRDSISGFGTPAVWRTPGSTQIAAPGYGRMIGYDLQSGEELWQVNIMPASGCSTPIVAGDNLLYAGWSPGASDDSEGFKMPTYDELLAGNDADANKDGVFSKDEAERTPFRDFFDNNDPDKDGRITRHEWDQMLAFIGNSKNGVYAVKPGGRGDITQSHVIWVKKSGLPYVPSPIILDDQIVMVKDGGIVTSYDVKSGDMKFQKRAVAGGEYYASPVSANGLLYFTSLKEGVVTVLKPTADGFERVFKSPEFEERIAATPMFADNRVYLRTASRLYAFGAKAPSE